MNPILAVAESGWSAVAGFIFGCAFMALVTAVANSLRNRPIDRENRKLETKIGRQEGVIVAQRMTIDALKEKLGLIVGFSVAWMFLYPCAEIGFARPVADSSTEAPSLSKVAALVKGESFEDQVMDAVDALSLTVPLAPADNREATETILSNPIPADEFSENRKEIAKGLADVIAYLQKKYPSLVLHEIKAVRSTGENRSEPPHIHIVLVWSF